MYIFLIYKILPDYTFNIVFIESILYFIKIDKLHQAYHSSNHWLNKYKWFRYKKDIHHIHHFQTKTNLNLTDPVGDKLFKTYKSTI